MFSDFYKNKKVLVTGHTGFKGAWLCKVLTLAGADVIGYSLNPPTEPSLYDIISDKNIIHSVIGDINDLDHMLEVFKNTQPEIVIHMAAQPLVRESYKNPVYTYRTNVIGTVNLLECVRTIDSVKSVINVTTDKVYLNKEWVWGYREIDELNGYDPYSNSKSCSELVTSSYIKSFFQDKNIAISTLCAGNVIGGGDFAKDRIIPDCVKSAVKKQNIIVRNPYSIRPYQHVLDPLFAYLMIAKVQYENKENAGNYNVGPDEKDCITTGELADLFCKIWNKDTTETVSWDNKYDGGPHEANFLKLDCSKIKSTFGWRPVWNVETAVNKTIEWVKANIKSEDIDKIMKKQIEEFSDEWEN